MADLTVQQTSQAPISVLDIVGVVKAIVPRSFEKAFEGMEAKHIANAFKVCVEGLSREQINNGMSMVREQGFCPDPAVFRKWCLGIQGFGTEQERVRETFKGKHAALATIIRWREDRQVKITNAEKEAYDRCYSMFLDLDYAKNYERSSYYAYEAFKDNYADVIREFSEQGIRQALWIKPVEIAKKTEAKNADFGSDKPKTPEEEAADKAKVQQYIANLKSLLKQPVASSKKDDESMGGGV
ncbi:hypothetical protein [Acinetobacter sp.]|uniref:hypothetical protein n=1 Tax=Acinetobacter sp. TaxID=472 RepID=UPI00290D43A5|nr:hypothetical protein [Acinetobacter sp.]MDU4032423.1 hypothetical protein [Acinetobacter sp.]